MHYLRGRWNVFQHKHIGIKNILIERHLCVYELLLMLINVQWEGAKKIIVRVLLGTGTRGNKHKLKYGKICLNMRKKWIYSEGG